MKNTLYAVMGLKTKVTISMFGTEYTEDVDLSNEIVAGYIPVYKSLEEAEKHANGKYAIVAIKEEN